MRLLTALTLAALLAGCGGDEPEPPPTQQPEESAQPPAAVPAAPRPEADTGAQAEPEPGAEARVGDRRLYTVQAAAFLNAVTAREWTERLQDQEIPVWTSTARVDGRMYHRLRLGAVPELSDARRLADMIRARHHWPVWIAPLEPSDRLPLNAVQRTREALRSGR